MSDWYHPAVPSVARTFTVPAALLGVALAGGVPGCASAPPGPRPTLLAVADALERHDPEAIEALRARTSASPSTENGTLPARDELVALATVLREAPIERRAAVSIPSAEGPARPVLLVEEGGVFRVEAGILGVPALDTPERAIASLHRALAREVALGPGSLLASSERRTWLDERERYRDGTEDPDALDVRVEGDRASAMTPLGDEIVLVREGGDWRVLSMRAAGLE